MAVFRSRRLAELALDRGGLISLVVLVTGFWLAPSHIVDGDNAEFSTLSATGGISHPPGYPLYVLYLRAMSWLPGVSAAHSAALATVILGAAAMLALHAGCRAWGARPSASSLAVAILAGGPIVLGLITAAEVFALNVLIVGVVLWLSALNGPVRGAWRAVLLGFVAGLGLCNHLTCVLVAPVGVLGAIRGIRESPRSRAATTGLALAGLALGFSPYVYLLVAPATAASWGHAESLRDLVAYFTRADYGGIGAFSARPGEISPVQNVLAFLFSLARGWLWLPAIVGVAMLAYRTVRTGTGETRAGWATLAASFVLAGPVLIARFNVPPEGFGLAVCQRFYLLPIVLLTIPVALGVDRVMSWVTPRISVALLQRRLMRELVPVLVFIAAVGLSLPHILAIHSPAVERGVVNLVRSLPEGAVVIVMSDDLYFGARYVQATGALRPDVDVIAWTMTTLPWYRAQLAGRGLPIDPYAEGPEVPSVRVARQVFATGRPLFVEFSLGNILKELRSYPYGLVFRVLPPDAPMPGLDDIVAVNRQVFAAFDLAYPRPTPDAAYAVEMHLRYARTWDILVRALAAAGRIDEAREARTVIEQLTPSWQPAVGR